MLNKPRVVNQQHVTRSRSPSRCLHVTCVHTGAPVPTGADAVVQVEDTTPAAAAAEGGQKRVCINQAAKPGQDIRPVGSDIE